MRSPASASAARSSRRAVRDRAGDLVRRRPAGRRRPGRGDRSAACSRAAPHRPRPRPARRSPRPRRGRRPAPPAAPREPGARTSAAKPGARVVEARAPRLSGRSGGARRQIVRRRHRRPATARRSPRAWRRSLRTRSRIAASPANTSVTSVSRRPRAGSAIIVRSSSRTAPKRLSRPSGATASTSLNASADWHWVRPAQPAGSARHSRRKRVKAATKRCSSAR